jgi:hypothetical protein
MVPNAFSDYIHHPLPQMSPAIHENGFDNFSMVFFLRRRVYIFIRDAHAEECCFDAPGQRYNVRDAVTAILS